MTESKPPAKSSHSNVSVAMIPAVAELQTAGKNLRRLKGDESFDDKGVRTIWHRSASSAEMLTWETKDQKIIKQEFTFFFLAVIFDKDRMIRTGRISPFEESTGPVQSQGQMIKMDPGLSLLTLDAASELLKHIEQPDYFCTHLRKHVNLTLASLRGDSERTIILGDPVGQRVKSSKSLRPKSSPAKPRTTQDDIDVIRGPGPWLWLAAAAALTAAMAIFFYALFSWLSG